MLKFNLILIFIIIGVNSVFAQEEVIESLLEQQEEYSDISDLIELLSEIEQNPYDLNSVSAKELAILPWITDILAKKIIEFRSEIGRFNSIQELAQVSNFEPKFLPLLKKYISVKSISRKGDLRLIYKTRIQQNLENEMNSLNVKLYNRLICTYDERFKIGALFEKDNMEKKINDFQSYYFSFSNKEKSNKFVVGNYRLEFAQGMLFWNPYGYSKSSNPIYFAKKRERGIVGYGMVDENASLFGIASTICLRIYQLNFYYSDNLLDATLNQDGTVANFYKSGYHRTNLEKNKKDKLREQLAGAIICVKPSPNLFFGMTYYQSLYERGFNNSDVVRYRFAFEGEKNNLIGFDYDYIIGNFNLFGEFGRSRNGGFGSLFGAIIDKDMLNIAIIARKYSKDFHSLHGNSFGVRNGNPNNEQGIYFGLNYIPIPNVKISVYYDQYKFPWRTYLLEMPSSGNDMLFKLEYNPLKNMLLYLQFKSSKKEKLFYLINDYNNVVKEYYPKQAYYLRFQLNYKVLKHLQLRHRFEKKWSYYNQYQDLLNEGLDINTGILLYQEIIFRNQSNFSFAIRFTFFDTYDYDSRLYQFERDVPGVLTNKMLYGEGSRWYLYIQYKIKKHTRLAFKYSSTNYINNGIFSKNRNMNFGNQNDAISFQAEFIL